MSDPFDYVASRADADELIQDFGAVASVRRIVTSGSVFDPVQTPTDYPTFAAVIDYADRQIDGENILVTDRRALVAAGPLDALGITTVNPPDTLIVGGVELPIIRVKPLSPAGVVVMFDCQVRF